MRKAQGESMTDRLRRSFLYTPADKPDMMQKAPATDADAVIFDIEDAVRPADKGDARENVRSVVPELDAGETELCVRINGLETTDWVDDLLAALDAAVHTIVVPEIESPQQVIEVTDAASEHTDDPPEFSLVLETPAAIFGGQEIATAAADISNVTALTYGASDYARAVGAVPTSSRLHNFLAHRAIGFASLGGLQPVASVYPRTGELETVREFAQRALEIGCVGQSVIHPDQATVVNEVFTPEREEVEEARRLLDGFDSSEQGATVVDGIFLDKPLLRRYRTIIRRYEAIHGDT